MNLKIKQPIIAGVIGTAVMSLVMFLAPMLGMPKMRLHEMLSIMMGFPIIVGWVMHFMIGVIFAMTYAFFFMKVVKKVHNNILKGAIFGMAVFFFAQIMMAVMGMVFPVPPMEGSMVLIMVGSILGDVIYGITVAMFVKEQNI